VTSLIIHSEQWTVNRCEQPKKAAKKGVILLFRKRGQSKNQNDPFSRHRQTAVGWVGSTPIYRGSSTSASTSTRRVQYSESAFSVTLDPGTYWIDFQMTSSAFSLFVPPLSVSGGGSVVTGNALHFSNASWSAAVDVLSGRAKGMPFQILGSTEQVVPEPSSVVLTALGVAGFVLLRRRRK
jgi:hypothetical protein